MTLEDLASGDLVRYQYAELAKRLSRSEEGQAFVPVTLGKFIQKLEETNDDAALSTKIAVKLGGAEDVIKAYSGKYQKSLDSLSVEEYLTANGADVKSLKDNFEGLDEKYGDVRERLEDAKYVIEGIKNKRYKFPEGELEIRRKDIMKYGGIYLFTKTMEDARFEKLRGEVTGEGYEKSISEILKNPEKYVKAAFKGYLEDKEESAEQDELAA